MVERGRPWITQQFTRIHQRSGAKGWYVTARASGLGGKKERGEARDAIGWTPYGQWRRGCVMRRCVWNLIVFLTSFVLKRFLFVSSQQKKKEKKETQKSTVSDVSAGRGWKGVWAWTGTIFWYLCWCLIKGADSAGGPIPHTHTHTRTPSSLDQQVLLDFYRKSKKSQEETTAVMPLRCGQQHSVNCWGSKIITIITAITATNNNMRASFKFCTSESKSAQTSVLAHCGRQPSPTTVQKQNVKWIILLFDTRRPNKSSANLLSGLRSGEWSNEPPNITSVPKTRGEFQYWTSVKWYPF